MVNPNELRILIADDHEIVRRGLKSLIASRPGWEVCAEAASGRQAVALATRCRPDIAVIDISMPGLNGLEATRKIRKTAPKTEILILSLHYSDQLVREVVDAGARGYLLKTDATRDLTTARHVEFTRPNSSLQMLWYCAVSARHAQSRDRYVREG